jgi:two-component system OmpR family response regulator
MRILLFEYEMRLADVIAGGLSRAGFTVDNVASIGRAEAALSTELYDILVLDLDRPNGDGMSVLRDLRQVIDRTLVLILSAHDGLDGRIEDSIPGADAKLLKPFAMSELVACLLALSYRLSGTRSVQLEIGNVRIDTISKEIEVAERPIALTKRELFVLKYLMRQAGRVVSDDVLKDRVHDFEKENTENSLDVIVQRLRWKLVNSGATVHLHAVVGLGYLLQDNQS